MKLNLRNVIVAGAAALALSGCVSTLDGAYDEQARRQCERETRASERGACLDRVDQHRRERD